MRRYEHISLDDKKVFSLQFVADTITIFNPTKRTIVVRAGGSDIPSSVNTADVVCPPATSTTAPVHSDTFAVGFSDPSLSISTSINSATIIWTAGEQPPQLSSITLDNIISKYNAIFLNTIYTNNGSASMDVTLSSLASGIILSYRGEVRGFTPNYINVSLLDKIHGDRVYTGNWSPNTGSLVIPINPSSNSYSINLLTFLNDIAIDVFEYQGPINASGLTISPYQNAQAFLLYQPGTINANSTFYADITSPSPFLFTNFYAEVTGVFVSGAAYELCLYFGSFRDGFLLNAMSGTIESGKLRFRWQGQVFVDIIKQTIGLVFKNPTSNQLTLKAYAYGYML